MIELAKEEVDFIDEELCVETNKLSVIELRFLRNLVALMVLLAVMGGNFRKAYAEDFDVIEECLSEEFSSRKGESVEQYLTAPDFGITNGEYDGDLSKPLNRHERIVNKEAGNVPLMTVLKQYHRGTTKEAINNKEFNGLSAFPTHYQLEIFYELNRLFETGKEIHIFAEGSSDTHTPESFIESGDTSKFKEAFSPLEGSESITKEQADKMSTYLNQRSAGIVFPALKAESGRVFQHAVEPPEHHEKFEAYLETGVIDPEYSFTKREANLENQIRVFLDSDHYRENSNNITVVVILGARHQLYDNFRDLPFKEVIWTVSESPQNWAESSDFSKCNDFLDDLDLSDAYLVDKLLEASHYVPDFQIALLQKTRVLKLDDFKYLSTEEAQVIAVQFYIRYMVPNLESAQVLTLKAELKGEAFTQRVTELVDSI